VSRQRNFIGFTLLISILLGILLPLALGVRDPALIATTFTLVWFLYAMILFIYVFLIRRGLKIKILRHKNPATVRYELRDPRRGQDCSHDSIRVSESTSLTKVQKESGLNSLN
jgi:hypothetical protein